MLFPQYLVISFNLYKYRSIFFSRVTWFMQPNVVTHGFSKAVSMHDTKIALKSFYGERILDKIKCHSGFENEIHPSCDKQNLSGTNEDEWIAANVNWVEKKISWQRILSSAEKYVSFVSKADPFLGLLTLWFIGWGNLPFQNNRLFFMLCLNYKSLSIKPVFFTSNKAVADWTKIDFIIHTIHRSRALTLEKFIHLHITK